MANRVTIHIHNQNYHITAEEDPRYIQQCAEFVRREIDQAMDGTALSLTDGAVLACLNLADKLAKERQVSDNLRAQLKEALDENIRLKRGGKGKRGKGQKSPDQEIFLPDEAGQEDAAQDESDED